MFLQGQGQEGKSNELAFVSGSSVGKGESWRFGKPGEAAGGKTCHSLPENLVF